MKRLYLQIYLAVVVSLFLMVLAAGLLWRIAGDAGPWMQGMEIASEVAAAALPPVEAPREAQQQALDRLSQRLRADFALYDARRHLVASAGNAIPGASDTAPAEASRGWGPWTRHDEWGGWRINLPDGRQLALRPARDHKPAWWGWPAWLLALFVIALAVGIAAHPVVRRITRRVERLEKSVNALGEGDLSARVKVRGHDEVARLAKSFNRAAARIEALVKSHRNLLANASHELRTPLARIRMGVELLKVEHEQRRAPERAARLEADLNADIAELDGLIDEILTASRLQAGAAVEAQEEVDFVALAAEECARYEDCRLDAPPLNEAASSQARDGSLLRVRGEPRLLRRLLRNLLENAHRHGAPPIEVALRTADNHSREVVLRVRDHGAGVPEAERERIFDPFYRLTGSTATGTGLGLALVRQIARQHGGDAKLVVADGRGTCIEVRLGVSGDPNGRPLG